MGLGAAEFPVELDATVYGARYQDLRGMDEEGLLHHYATFGRAEGRSASEIDSRQKFVELARAFGEALEIGPFHSPVLSGHSVSYSDVLDVADLKRRAAEHGLNPDRIPERIHYLMRDGVLDCGGKQFELVLSSHSIEHQPNLVRHLREVESVLLPGGAYFVICPDKRYCFDYPHPESSIADILEAYFAGRRTHSLASVIRDRALATHNDAQRYWSGETPSRPLDSETVKRAIDEWQQANGSYIDVHAWHFTPQSFRKTLTCLQRLGLTSLSPLRVYETPKYNNEFYAILTRA